MGKINAETQKNFFGYQPVSEGRNVFSYPVHCNDYIIYIDDMSWLEDHQERLQTIRQANPDDTIRIIINSPGGSVSLAMAYVSAIRESQGNIVTHAEGNVCSAGTVLWLACDDRTVSPLTIFMFHNYQGGTYGDGANMFSQVAFEKQYFERLMDTFYKGVLTDTELATIKGGGQVWMDEVEVLKRTHAVLMDAKNIKRLQQGQPPVSTDPTKKEEKGDDGKKTAAILTVTVEDEQFKFDLTEIKEKDFDGFNVEELQSIRTQLSFGVFGEEPGIVLTKRSELLEELMSLCATIQESAEAGELEG